MHDSRLSTILRLRIQVSSIRRSAGLLFQISWCTVSAASVKAFRQRLQVICAATAVAAKTDEAEEAAAYGARVAEGRHGRV